MCQLVHDDARAALSFSLLSTMSMMTVEFCRLNDDRNLAVDDSSFMPIAWPWVHLKIIRIGKGLETADTFLTANLVGHHFAFPPFFPIAVKILDWPTNGFFVSSLHQSLSEVSTSVSFLTSNIGSLGTIDCSDNRWMPMNRLGLKYYAKVLYPPHSSSSSKWMPVL